MSLKIEYAIIARCRPERLWQVFTQLERWPHFDPATLSEARWLSGAPWTPGARFVLGLRKPVPIQLMTEVVSVEPAARLQLRGEGSGVTAEQHYELHWDEAPAATELRTIQEFSGAPIMFFGSAIKPQLEQGIAQLFAGLVAEAEA